MSSFVARFHRLVSSGSRAGYVELVRPLTFEEQVEQQRRIRDVEGLDPAEKRRRATHFGGGRRDAVKLRRPVDSQV